MSMPSTIPPFVVPPESDGSRLDAVIAELVPHMGLRGRRRLCEDGHVLVNGNAAKPAFKVRPGQSIELAGLAYENENCECARVLQQTEHLAFLHKPAGMHTAALAGKIGDSLEAQLPSLLPSQPAARLLNRLDAPTSGIVVVALDADGEDFYHSAQENGLAIKRYLALLEGRLELPMEAGGKILQDDRNRVRMANDDEPDIHRHTLLYPLGYVDAKAFMRLLFHCSEMPANYPQDMTLAGCVIFKGARHQIRAHAAALGHPLAGDVRYGATPWKTMSCIAFNGNYLNCKTDKNSDIHITAKTMSDVSEFFFLHHGRMTLPGMDICIPPAWLDILRPAGNAAIKNSLRWLHSASIKNLPNAFAHWADKPKKTDSSEYIRASAIL